MTTTSKHRSPDPNNPQDALLDRCYGDLRKGAYLRRRSAYRSLKTTDSLDNDNAGSGDSAGALANAG